MFQKTICINNNSKNLCKYVEIKLKKPIKNSNGIIAKTQNKNLLLLHIGCEENYKNYIENELYEILCDVYLINLKFEFYLKNIRLPQIHIKDYHTLLHALVDFDLLQDKELINKNIVSSSIISVDGIFNFSLGSLKEKWYEIIQLTNENSYFLLNSEALKELLNFLKKATNK